MAYARWSDGDVYVYSDVYDRHGEIRCCSCTLRFVSQPVGGVYETPYPSFIAKGPKEMIDHLLEHEAVGHKVPKYAYTYLRKDAKAREEKPIKYPVHFLSSKLENIFGEVVAAPLGTMPLCDYRQNAHIMKILKTKKSENGHAHYRDESTLNKKKVTCKECKKILKLGLDYVPFKGKKNRNDT